MTTEFANDICDMHDHYGHRDAVADFDRDKLRALLEFRKNFLREEMSELDSAETPEDVVDALVDLVVVAIGTLDLFDVDIHRAWDEVHYANMRKQTGIKESRPNELGLPDLIKPPGWEAPDHTGNVGLLEKVFTE